MIFVKTVQIAINLKNKIELTKKYKKSLFEFR